MDRRSHYIKATHPNELIIGEKKTKSNGYLSLYVPNHPRRWKKDTGNGNRIDCIYEHIIIMEQHLGRFLELNECVHHKDHDRSNNTIDNLLLITRGEHSKLHCKERFKKPSTNTCSVCGLIKKTVTNDGVERCWSCYLKYRESLKPLQKCSRCGKDRKIHAKELCGSCYNFTRSSKSKSCLK